MNTKNLKRKSILLFETIQVKEFHPLHLEYHLKRANAATSQGLQFDVKSIISVPHAGKFRVKVIFDHQGNFVDVEVYEYVQRKIESIRLIHTEIDYSKKYLQRSAIDRLFMQRGQCDDILMVKNNLITDTSIANIALYHQNGWITPKTPLLKGTVRERYIQKHGLREQDITIELLLRAPRIALMNAMIDFHELPSIRFVL